VSVERAAGLVSLERARTALALLWLFDAGLQLQPAMFTDAFVGSLVQPAAEGQPAPVAGAILFMAQALTPHIGLWNALLAATQALIGFGLLFESTSRAALLLSFAWSVPVWFFGEGLGGLLTGRASLLAGAPGAVLLYVLLGLVLWPREGDCQRAVDRVGRAGWAALWIGGGLLQLQPAYLEPGALSYLLNTAATDAPAAFAGMDHALARDLLGRDLVFAPLFAGLAALIGQAVLIGWHRRLFLGAGVVTAIVLWLLPGRFGELFTGMPTDPGVEPLIVLLGLVLLAAPAPRKRELQRELKEAHDDA
jgi:hypothetical protein